MEKLRTLAMYLPQFHRVLENDLWWGEGFTEWTAVKNAKSYFKGHKQPRRPIDGNYYDLENKETMEWQASLAHKYGINGFCFYHYWFKNGRKILEKPAENLLRWKDIELLFCFCWDPVSWARTWTNLGNSWTEKFEPNRESNTDRGLLLEQEYGSEKEWKDHFYYLLPFFRDKRYIKKDKKPVFMFTISIEIPCISRMISYWRKLAQNEGLPGIYVIVTGQPVVSADAVIFPMSYFGKSVWGYDERIGDIITGTTILGYDYDAVWQNYLCYQPTNIQPTLWMCMLSYDDTPRRGENGRIYLGASPRKFKNYYALLVEKSRKTDNPFIFIDAWNEWGEGKYLEPDTINGYEYLEAIRDIMELDDEQLARTNRGYHESHGAVSEYKKYIGNIQRQLMESQIKNKLLDDWICMLTPRNMIEKYLLEAGISSIAIYGFGRYGRLLYNAISGDSVKVIYAIDRKKDSIQSYAPIPIYDLEDDIPICELVIISVFIGFEHIFRLLEEKLKCPVISLSEIISKAKKLNGGGYC